MNTLIADYLYRGVMLWLEDGNVRYRMRAGDQSTDQIEEIRACKTEILDALTKEKAEGGWNAVTENQRALILHQMLHPADTAYNIAVALDVPSHIGSGELSELLTTLCAWHPSLKRIYKIKGDHAYQRVASEIDIPLDVMRFASRPDCDEALSAFKRIAFTMDGSALIRTALYECPESGGDALRVCVLVLHHLNVDFWSLGIIVRSLERLMSGNGKNVLTCGSDGFLEHVARQFLQAPPTAQMEHWRSKLAHGYEPLSLPSHAAEQRDGAAEPRSIEFQIPSEMRTRILNAARQATVSPFVVVLASVFHLLARITGKSSLAVCMPTFGRDEDERDAVGYFVNPLPVLLDLGSIKSVADLLGTLKGGVVEALDNDQISYSKILSIVRERFPEAAGREFPVFVNWNSLPEEAAEDLGEMGRLEQVGGFCPLMLTVSELNGAYAANWTCQSGYAQHLEDWHALFLETLEAIVSDTATELAALPSLCSADVALIKSANDTAVHYSDDSTILDSILAQCASRGSAAALWFDGVSISYASLEAETAALALTLSERGVGPGNFVALCFDRSPEMVLSMLAVMRAGAAFIPLDPSYPSARIDAMIADAEPVLVLTSGLFADLHAFPAHRSLVVNRRALANDAHGVKLFNKATATGAAYMLYTSGSTGQPKGVVIQHDALLNRLMWMQSAYDLGLADRVLQKTPYTFDVSMWEFFWPLMFGATLVIAVPNGHRDPDYLQRLIIEQQVTRLHFVPSMLDAYLEYIDIAQQTDLVSVFCSGEALQPAHVRKFFQSYPNVGLHNLYGPTEAAIDVSYFECQPRDAQRSIIPIGRPVGNTRLHILGNDGRLVPVGSVGDLYIEGIQLTSGYHKRDELNRERFLHVAIREYGGETRRLYKTGDLARWNHDGDIEYLGRDDHQVKIRGQRVELGEIDACLEQLPQVRSARTLLPSTGGASTLVSFVVRESEDTDEATAAQDIRAAAEAILPSHMRPSRICFVSEFPTTENGKLARNELLAHYDRTRAGEHGEEEKIRSGSLFDKRLTSSWTGVLGAPSASRGDSNFFLEGGDSIKALRLLGLLRKQGIDLTIHDLYVSQTLERLDARIREVGGAGTGSGLTGTPVGVFELADQPLTAEEKSLEDLYPLTTLQEVMYAQSLLNQNAAVYRDVFVVRVARPVDPTLFRAMILSMTSEHAVLRTRVFERDHGELAQGIVRHSDVDFSVTTLGDAEDFDASVDRMVRRLKRHQFNTVDDPLILFRLVQNSRKATLVVCFHHMILDGWSVASLIVQLFRSVSHGRLVHGASSKYRFADYVALERAESRSPESAAYWANTLDGVSPCLLKGPASQNGSVSQDNVAHEIVQISRTEHASLVHAARRIGAPLKSILMTMHGYALARLFNQERILTGYVVDGRPEFENYESVLGLHLNTLPIVLDFPACSAADVARKAASQEVKNLPYRRYPLHSITRDAKRGKLFDTVFNFTSFHVYDEGEADASLVEDVEPHEFTDFDFVSSFSIHPKSKELRLRLDFNSAVVTAEQVVAIRQAYGEIIGKLVRSEEACVLECVTPQDDVRRALATASMVYGVERARDATQDGASKPCLELTPTVDAVPQLAYFTRHPELKTHRLSNDLVISVINRTEADFNFQEIFEDSYFKRLALALPSQATVFDVGGNIGLFTLSLFDEHPDMRFFVYEPMAEIASALRHNMRAHLVPADVVEKALSRSIGKADFVFYENNTLISGLYADVDDIEVTAQALVNQQDVSAENDGVNMSDLIADRLSTRTVEVETTTLSAEIRRLDISTIDLLKIDVEKAEMDVLAGIDADDWEKIRNLYIEVHDIGGRLAEITSMLVRQGFFVIHEQESLLRGTAIHVLAASRDPISLRQPSAQPIWRSSERQMVLNVATALDKAGLDSNKFEVRIVQQARSLTTPRRQDIASSYEDEVKLRNLWATMFDEHPLDLDKSFYELGIDSISLLRFLRRANAALGSNTPVAAVKVDMTPGEFLALGTNFHGSVVVQPIAMRQNAPVLLFVVPFATTPRIYDEVIQGLTSTCSIKVLRAPEQAYRDGNFDRILDEQFEDWRRDASSASAIVGWSLGGNLALAISESLFRREEICPNLVLIDSYFCNDNLKIDDFKADIEGARHTDDYLEERIQLLKGYRPTAAPSRGLYIKAIQNERSRVEGVVEGGAYLKEGVRVEIDADHFTIMQGNAATQVARAIRNFVGIETVEKLEAV